MTELVNWLGLRIAGCYVVLIEGTEYRMSG